MKFRIIGMMLGLLLSGCVTAGPGQDALNAAARRDLTLAEKIALAGSLAQTFKDPSSAQFKWMPVVLIERDGITDYCGLVNGRNSYGGYAGYQKFYAQLVKNPKSEFTRGFVQATASDNVSTQVVEGLCDRYGYGNLSAAN